MTGIVDSILPHVNDILGIRDSVGAIIQPIYFVTRTWYIDAGFTTPASQIGEGYGKDVVTQMLPTPRMKEYSQDIRLTDAGAIKAGDIILSSVSKQTYTYANLDSRTNSANIEKLYMIDDTLYQVINITERYVSWNVQLRELTNQTRYI